MSNQKHIVLVSASPKAKQDQSVSDFIAKRGDTLLNGEVIETHVINVRRALTRKETQDAYQTLMQADAIVMIFPLYFFCMPGMLTRFLQDFAADFPQTQKKTGVYAIVNCGFPEPDINLEALRVVERFTIQTGRSFCGGVMVGCGGMILGVQRAPFMKPVYDAIDGLFNRVKNDVLSGGYQDNQIDSIAVNFPRKLYFIAGNAGWKSMARKNHLHKEDLYRKPYQQ